LAGKLGLNLAGKFGGRWRSGTRGTWRGGYRDVKRQIVKIGVERCEIMTLLGSGTEFRLSAAHRYCDRRKTADRVPCALGLRSIGSDGRHVPIGINLYPFIPAPTRSTNTWLRRCRSRASAWAALASPRKTTIGDRGPAQRQDGGASRLRRR